MESQPENPGKRARELFGKLCDRPREEWSAYLDACCPAGSDLRREVESLLEQDCVDRDWLEQLEKEVIRTELETLQGDRASLSAWMDSQFTTASNGEGLKPYASFGDYELLEVIGQGGMGVVYKARDKRLKRDVAIKFLPAALNSNKAAKDRFMNEARAVSGIDHPNIATIHEVGETGDGQMYIVMGYYKGTTLKGLIDQGTLDPARALDLVIQLAMALEAIHRGGVIHRDIKPGNLLITEEGVLKLLDFGLAKLAHASGVTQVGEFMGTVAYMSPEQILGQAVDARTDIWALGAVLFECLRGRPPFEAEEFQSAIHAILNADPKLPSPRGANIPGSAWRIIERCLEKEPDDRYASAGELLQDLKRIRDGEPPGVLKGRRFRKFMRKRRIPVVLSLALPVIIVVVLSILNATRREGAPERAYPFTGIQAGALAEQHGNFLTGSWADYDNDGWMDVLLTENDRVSGRFHLFRNKGDSTFSPSNTDLFSKVHSAVVAGYWADPDNDGDLDLLLTTDNAASDLLYYNDGQGGFSLASDQPWMLEPTSTHAAAWGDYDNDGWLDLVLPSVSETELEPCRLLRNRGNGILEDAQTAFTQLPRDSHGCYWTDYDSDGDLDLFLSGHDQIQFRNDGAGEFAWVGPDRHGLPVYTQDIDVGMASADYDNDGDLDMAYIVWGTKTGVLLYRNELGHSYNDITHLLPETELMRGMGIAWGDYDNDGWLDLFVSNSLGRNRLYHNEGNDSFTVVEDSPVTALSLQACGCQWVDFDNDGDLDLFVANGAWSNFKQPCEVFLNGGGPNHWILVNLVGTVSNRSGIGAKVWARTTVNGAELTQLREVSSGGNGCTGSGLRVHFGLGTARHIDTLRVEWPSGIVQELHDVAVDQLMEIREQAD